MQSESIIRDPSLAPDGHKKIDWAAEHSPVLNIVRDKYLKDGTFDGLGVGVALPIEAKTAYLTVTLAEAGAVRPVIDSDRAPPCTTLVLAANVPLPNTVQPVVPLRERSTMKPVSLPALSVQVRLI